MRTPRTQFLAALLLPPCLALLPTSAHAAPVKAAAKKTPIVTVTRLTWHGWPNSIRITNGVVEAVVVPTIGRITSFHFIGHPETDPIFINKDWEGKTVADADPATWAAFGGDKLWPSPQSEWPKHNVRGWPPDQAFDGDPENAQIVPGGVRLTTAESTAFAARATRTITMRPGQARLYVAQTLIKDADARNAPLVVVPDDAAPPAGADPQAVDAFNEAKRAATRAQRDGFPIGLWSITQTRGDGTIFLPLSSPSRFPAGYKGGDAPGTPSTAPYFTAHAGLLRVLRDPKNPRKIGTDAPDGWMALLYAGNVLFSEHFTYQPGTEYPDGGTPSEVFTSPGPAYFEIELLGPLIPLTHGNKITHDVYWQLQRLPRAPQSRADAETLVKAAMK